MATSFNLVDLLLALIVLMGLWGGWRRGFVLGALDLASFGATLLFALWAYPWPARWLELFLSMPRAWALPAAFLATYILARIVLGTLAGRTAMAVPRAVHANAGNRLLGLAPGFASGLLYAAVVSMLVGAFPLFGGLAEQAQRSVIAQRLAAPAQWLEKRLAPIFEEAAERTLTRVPVEPGSQQRIALRYKVQDPKPRPDLEARMLELVNAERAKAGLDALAADPELAEVARAHSRDMFARGYFSHVSPDGADPFDRIRAARVRYLTAGENIALAPTLPVAHQGLMNSPGHRANILRPAFGRVGIGIVDGGMRGQMVTQNFRN